MAGVLGDPFRIPKKKKPRKDRPIQKAKKVIKAIVKVLHKVY